MRLSVKKPLIIITGPTAVGKTDLSLTLVQEFNGEIISSDSRLFYRGMDIGTAKPSLEERQLVKHHLIDIADINETLNLAVFQQEVYQIAEGLWAEDRVPFLVGGTGQFVRAIMEGWVIPPEKPNFDLRNTLEHWGNSIGAAALYDKLKIVDPDAAKNIEPGNLRRTVRALEVIISTGELFSTQRRRQLYGLQFKVVGLIRDRKELYQRIDDRIDKMLEKGFELEVRGILAKGYQPELPALSAIGYKEMIDFINGKISKDEVTLLMKRRTRQYVRRQANWFKQDDPRIRWFDVSKEIMPEVKEFILSTKGWQDG